MVNGTSRQGEASIREGQREQQWAATVEHSRRTKKELKGNKGGEPGVKQGKEVKRQEWVDQKKKEGGTSNSVRHGHKADQKCRTGSHGPHLKREGKITDRQKAPRSVKIQNEMGVVGKGGTAQKRRYPVVGE